MIVENWKYTKKLFRSTEYDAFRESGLFSGGSLSRIVDLGWDQLDSMVHLWANTLNSVSGKICQKTGLGGNKLKLNQKTFDLLWIRANEYFNSFESKLNFYDVEISKDVEDNIIDVYSNDKLEGKINIVI